MRSVGSSGRCVSSSKRLRASLVLWKRRRGLSICRACSTKTTPMTSSGSSEPPTTSPSSARAPDVRETLSERNLQALRRATPVVEARQRHARDAGRDRALARPEVAFLLGGQQREGLANRLRPGAPSYAMDVPLGLVRDLVA